MDQYFQLLTHKSQSLKYPPRIRFLLRDVIELRKNKWIPRNINRTEGPVPIQELTNDDELLRPTYNNRNRDNRNQNRESDHWMNKLPLNLQPGYNDMFNSLSVSSPTQLINQP
jgi:translation initiation factor 4G